MADDADATLNVFTAYLSPANMPSAPQISLPSWSGHISPSCHDFSDTFFLDYLSICTSATAVVELCSPRSEVPWKNLAASRRALTLLWATTRTVSVLSLCVFRMPARRFMGCQNVHFVKTSVSKPSALGLRFLKRSHPCFSIAPRRPSVNPQPGVRLWSSRRWRASRRALSLILSPEHEFAGWIHAWLFIS